MAWKDWAWCRETSSQPGGSTLFKGRVTAHAPPHQRCHIQDQHFVASLPGHIDLLWELEMYLRPIGPGRYSLSRRGLNLYSGDPDRLIFSSPAELKQLRRQPALRKYMDDFLSPQPVLKNLKRRGYTHRIDSSKHPKKEAHPFFAKIHSTTCQPHCSQAGYSAEISPVAAGH